MAAFAPAAAVTTASLAGANAGQSLLV